MDDYGMIKGIKTETVMGAIANAQKSAQLARVISSHPNSPLLSANVAEIYKIRPHIVGNAITYRHFRQNLIQEIFAILDALISADDKRPDHANNSASTLIAIASKTQFYPMVLKASSQARIIRVAKVLSEKTHESRAIPIIETAGDAIRHWAAIANMQQQRNIGNKTIGNIRSIIEAGLLGALTAIADKHGIPTQDLTIDVEAASQKIYYMDVGIYDWIHQHGVDYVALLVRAHIENGALIVVNPEKKNAKRLYEIPGLNIPSALSPHEFDVLMRRYGIERPSETLQDIADSMNISRERVRQVHFSAVKALAASADVDALQAIVNQHNDAVIKAVTDDQYFTTEDYLKHLDRSNSACGKLDGYLNLSIAAGYGGFCAWAAKKGVNIHGLITFPPLSQERRDIEALYDRLGHIKRTKSDEDYLNYLDIERRSGTKHLQMVLLMLNQHLLDNKSGTIQKRIKKAQGKLSLLSAARDFGHGSPVDAVDLANYYVPKRHKITAGSPNSVLKELKKGVQSGFIHLYGNLWFPVPLSDLGDLPQEQPPITVQPSNQIWIHEAQSNGTIGVLHRRIANRGPIFEAHRVKSAQRTFGEIIDNNDKIILKTNPNFINLSPHLFGIVAHLDRYMSMRVEELMPFVSPKVINIYIENQGCGGDDHLYPLWKNPKWVMAMLDWSFAHYPEIIPRLISAIPSIGESWSDRDIRHIAQLKQELIEIDSQPILPPSHFLPPPAERFVAAMVYLWWTREASWVPVSRIAYSIMNERLSASYLATLCRIGVASPATHWKAPHGATSRLAPALNAVLRDMRLGLAPSWTSGALHQLLSSPKISGGWVDEWRPTIREDAVMFFDGKDGA